MIFLDAFFDLTKLKASFSNDLEALSNLIACNVTDNEEIFPLPDYLERFEPLYFSTFNDYLRFLLLFLFTEKEIQEQQGNGLFDQLPAKKQEDLMFSDNDIITLPETIQAFFSKLWNFYSFSFEEFFLTEQLLEKKMDLDLVNRALEQKESMQKLKEISPEQLKVLLHELNSGLLFLHNSLHVREQFINQFFKINGLVDLRCDFFRLILSLDYGNVLLILELIKLKAFYTRICKLHET